MLRLLEEQTEGWIHAGDFTGGGATNPYCTFQANYLRRKDGSMKLLAHGEPRTSGLSEQARDFVARQWSGNGCGEEKTGESCCGEPPREENCCCGEETGRLTLDTSSLDDFLREIHRNTLAVSGMLFQDAWNLELDRLRRCYILESDSRYGMVPFCIYNLTGSDGRALYR